MQYILCPRCKFRVQLHRHMCATCGNVMPLTGSSRAVKASDDGQQAEPKGTFWRMFLGIDPPEPEAGKQPPPATGTQAVNAPPSNNAPGPDKKAVGSR